MRPPIDSRQYWEDYVTIGAFATDIRLSPNGKRLFVPVRGSATVTWIDINEDTDPLPGSAWTADPNAYAGPQTVPPSYLPFQLGERGGTCKAGVCTLGCNADPMTRTCDSVHNAGQLSDYGNTRQVTMPGEPFAMAFSQDGTALALTQQSENETSLFLTGLVLNGGPSAASGASSDDAGAGDAAASDAGLADAAVDAGPIADAEADSGDAALADGSTEAGLDAGASDAGAGDATVDGGSSPGDDAGSSEDAGGTNEFPVSIQFVVNDMPLGGDGIVAIPHDPAAIPNPDPANPLRPAFLQTSNQSAEIDLLRYYSDEGYQQSLNLPDGAPSLEDAGVAVLVGSSNLRPFLLKERIYSVSVSGNGSNSRGIAIDPTPRIRCEQGALNQGLARTSPQYIACAQTPARVFIASRSPPALVIGQVGGMTGDGTPSGTKYDPDQFSLSGNVPLSIGPSNVYVAPIVDKAGNYEVRVFIVCFDSQTIAIYDPDAQQMEKRRLDRARAVSGMAFDQFDINDVANHAPVQDDPRSSYTTIVNGKPVILPNGNTKQALLKYRFAYITSFTDSYIQVLDLDQSFKDDRLGVGGSTFENIVYTLGVPTPPIGSN